MLDHSFLLKHAYASTNFNRYIYIYISFYLPNDILFKFQTAKQID